MPGTVIVFQPDATHAEPQTLYSQAFDVLNFTRLTVVADANAVAAGTLTVSVEHSADLNRWYPLGSLSVLSAAGSAISTFTDFLRYVRAKSVLAGAGVSVTYSVKGVAKSA
ncbi:MAG: hypothetical protein ACT4PV_12220 [Planctomycetaceae bacterium]